MTRPWRPCSPTPRTLTRSRRSRSWSVRSRCARRGCTRARSRTSRSCAPGREPSSSLPGRPAGHATHVPELRVGRHHPERLQVPATVDATAADAARRPGDADERAVMTVDSSTRQRAGGRTAGAVGCADRRWRTVRLWTGMPGVVLVALIGAFLRLWQLGSLGFNSDEAVYAGQAASLAGDPSTPPTSRSSGRTRCSSSRCCRCSTERRERRRGPCAHRRLRGRHPRGRVRPRPAALRAEGGHRRPCCCSP